MISLAILIETNVHLTKTPFRTREFPMHKERYWLKALKILWVFAVIFCVILLITQYDHIHQRLYKINRIVEIKSKKLENRANNPIKSSKNAYLGVSTDRKWLNPEIPNLISNEPLFTLPADTNYDTKLLVRNRAEEKSYNIIVQRSAKLNEYNAYVGCTLAERNWLNPEIWVGNLAERVELVNDDKEFIIYLKKNVKWHKPSVDLDDPKYAWLRGDHYITAHDLKFSFDTIMNPQVEASAIRHAYNDLAEVEVIDDYTIRLSWNKKLFVNIDYSLEPFIIPEFIYAYSEDGSKIPEETFGLTFNNHWYNNRMIGCGPYEWKEHKQNMYFTLERIEDYFIGPKPAPKTIKYIFVKDDTTALLKLKAGDINVIEFLDRNIYRNQVLNANENSPFRNGTLNHKKYSMNGYGYIGWNNEHPIFEDKMVRRAMTYALDREKILKTVWAKLGQIATSNVSPFAPEYDPNIKPYPFDLDKAAQILKTAGWKDEDENGILEKNINGKKTEFEFSLLTYDYPAFKSMYSIYKEDLIKIGIVLNIQMLDWALLNKRMQDHDFDAFNGGWSAGITLDFYQIWHSSEAHKPGSSNYISFQNKTADALIEKLRETYDLDKRKEIVQKFQKLLHEEQPYTFRFVSEGVLAYQNYIHGIQTSLVRPEIKLFTANDIRK